MAKLDVFHFCNQIQWTNSLVRVMAVLLVTPLSSCSADNDVSAEQSNRTEIAKEIVPYLYIQESEGQMGGMRSVARMMYLTADGVGQLTVEGSDDTVGEIMTSSVQCKAFLAKTDKFVFPQKKNPKTTDEPLEILVTEFIPASVYIEVFTTKGELKKHSYSPKELPKEIAELINKTKDIILKGDKPARKPAPRYVRSSILSKAAVKQMRRAKAIQDVSFEAIKKQRLVYSAITHPRMLIVVPKDINPYEFVNKSFQLGRSVQLSIEDMSFQIRNIIKSKRREQK